MRPKTLGIACAIVAVLAAPVLAQDRSSCLDPKDYYRALKNCSEFIRNHPKDAVAYHMRGDVLAKNGDLGQAITDYSKAIEINPAYAPAYDSRATAYTTKGDYTRAVADVTKAGELAARKGKQVKASPIAATKPKAKARMSSSKPVGASDTKVTPFNPFSDGASPQ